MIIDQHPSKMSVSALGNLATKFCLSLSLNQDVMAVADSMLLDKNERNAICPCSPWARPSAARIACCNPSAAWPCLRFP